MSSKYQELIYKIDRLEEYIDTLGREIIPRIKKIEDDIGCIDFSTLELNQSEIKDSINEIKEKLGIESNLSNSINSLYTADLLDS